MEFAFVAASILTATALGVTLHRRKTVMQALRASMGPALPASTAGLERLEPADAKIIEHARMTRQVIQDAQLSVARRARIPYHNHVGTVLRDAPVDPTEEHDLRSADAWRAIHDWLRMTDQFSETQRDRWVMHGVPLRELGGMLEEAPAAPPRRFFDFRPRRRELLAELNRLRTADEALARVEALVNASDASPYRE